jgi:hypothetical protein
MEAALSFDSFTTKRPFDDIIAKILPFTFRARRVLTDALSPARAQTAPPRGPAREN